MFPSADIDPSVWIRVMLEYRFLISRAPHGIMVIPATAPNSGILRWDGVLIIQSGSYTGTKLHFNVFIPPDYGVSNTPPIIQVTSPCFHPLISPYNETDRSGGIFDFNILLDQDWNSEDFLYIPLTLLKKIFYMTNDEILEYTNTTNSNINEEAANLMKTDPDIYDERVNEMIEKEEEVIHNKNEQNDLDIPEFSTLHRRVINECLDISKNTETPVDLVLLNKLKGDHK